MAAAHIEVHHGPPRGPFPWRKLASAFATGAVLTVMTVALGLHAGGAGATTPPPYVEVVVQNPDYETLAVDGSGMTYGKSMTDEHGVWRSADHGETWTRVLTLASSMRVVSISALASGTLIAHVDTGSTHLYRSTDQGVTWTDVLTLPNSPVFYRTLTSDSITDGGGFVWLGTYNSGPSTPYDNYIYRSADDGLTWSVANTTSTHRHIHGIRFNPADGKLYVLFGDSTGDGIWVSSDNGSTLAPLCTDYACTTVDAAFDPAGSFMVFGQDNFTAQNRIVKVALGTGALTPIMDIPYDSFSSYRLASSTYLIGTTHENGVPIVDPNLHLYASIDGGDHFVDVFQKPIPYPAARADMRVQFSYPNGDFPIQVDGYGTIVGRLVIPAPPSSSAAPSVSGTAQVGLTLSGSLGSWSGTAPIALTEQWQRCDAAGGNCAPIASATGLTYVPTVADAGSTLRLHVDASNAIGNASADSAVTAVVTQAPSNTTLPALSGIAQVGQSLSGGVGSWNGTDPIAYAEQWLRCNAGGSSCVAIASATGLSYAPVVADVGGTLRLRVSATNVAGTVSADSAASAVVTIAPSNTVLPSVSGIARVGQTLTGSTGTWSGTAPIVITRQWQRCNQAGGNCLAIGSASGPTYAPGAADVGSTLRLHVDAVNGVGSASANSAVTAVVTVAPSNTSLPAVSGTAQVGQVLSGDNGSWDGTTPITYADQWMRCETDGTSCVAIPSATAPSYAPVLADVGSTLRLRVSASNVAGTVSASSAASAVVTVAPSNTELPSVSGTAQVGETLTGSLGSWDGSAPIIYGRQWSRCDAAGADCAPIPSATGLTYAPVSGDVGSTLRLTVDASNDAGAASADSAVTEIVTAAPSHTSLPSVSGLARVGQTLSGDLGHWDGTAPIVYSSYWLRCDAAGINCQPIPSSDGLDYAPVAADVGSTLRLRVIASNDVGALTVDSPATAVVVAPSGGGGKISTGTGPSANDPAPPAAKPGTPAKRTPSVVKGITRRGTSRSDVLRGTVRGDDLRGEGGDDTLIGLAGADYLVGGPGRDTIRAGDGNDVILARDGRRDVIDCGRGHDTVTADRFDVVRSSCEVVKRPKP